MFRSDVRISSNRTWRHVQKYKGLFHEQWLLSLNAISLWFKNSAKLFPKNDYNCIFRYRTVTAILVYGWPNSHLINVSHLCRKHNLKLHAEKCTFFRHEVTFLGHKEIWCNRKIPSLNGRRQRWKIRCIFKKNCPITEVT